MNTAILETRSSMSLAGRGMLVVLDGGIPHLEQLRRGLLPGAEVLELVPGDGLAQITAYLATHGGFSSLHVVSHGGPGQLFLGDRVVDLATLQGNRLALEGWRGAGGDRFEILLYGCNVGQGVAGSQFIEALAALTGATVAASPTPTGHASLGGRWHLSTQTAPLQAAIAFTPQTQANYPGRLAPFTREVKSEGELIQAIRDANLNIDQEDIIILKETTTFNLGTVASNDTQFFGATGLPIITDSLIIRVDNPSGQAVIQRASTAPAFRIMAIDGQSKAVNVTLQNLVISGGLANGVGLAGGDGGGILNVGGNLRIEGSTIQGNTAREDGGGILHVGTGRGEATLTMENSFVLDNTLTGGGLENGGAGIDADGNTRFGGKDVTVDLTNVQITGNNAGTSSGGGIRLVDGAKISLNGVTIADNFANFGSGIALGDANTAITFQKLTSSFIEENEGSGKNIESLYRAIPSLTDAQSSQITNQVIVDNQTTINQLIAANPELAGLLTQTPKQILGQLKNLGLIKAPLPLTLLVPEEKLFGNTIGDFGTDFNVPALDRTQQKLDKAAVVVERLLNLNDGRTVWSPVADETSVILQVDAGATLAPLSFRIRNVGSQPLNFGAQLNSTTFALESPPTLTSLAIGASIDFTLNPLNPPTAGNPPATVSFGVEGLDVLGAVDGTFNFDINVRVVEQSTLPFLSFDGTRFSAVAGAGPVKISVSNAPQATIKSAIEELFYVSGNDRKPLFSVLPVLGQPTGFGVGLQSFIFNFETKPFNIQLADGTTGQVNPNNTTGIHNIIFDTNGDGQFNSAQDLTLQINQNPTTELPPLGARTVQANGNGLQLIDLRGTNGGNAEFILYREATFNNTVGLYRIDDTDGRVGGIAPGQAGYAQAALANRVSGLDLTVANQQSRTLTSTLAGALYAPFIVVNAGVDAFLNSNSSNTSGGINAFFAFQAANPDAQNHIILLGSNTFGFEDLLGGGDRDFNDMIFQVQIS